MSMEDIDNYLSTSTILEITKHQHGIEKPNSEMTDAEIAKILRYIGFYAPDTVWVDGKPTLMQQGLGVMLSLTLYEFPWFYEKHELWQRN